MWVPMWSAASATSTMWLFIRTVGQGIALAILTELIRLVREQNGVFLTLEVRESNIPARRLYEKLGFSEAGRRRNFYTDPKEDALLLTLTLTD